MRYTPDASTLLRQMPLCLHVKRTPWSGELEQDHRTWTRTSNPQNQTESCSVSSSYHHWREDNKDWSLCAYIKLLKHQQDVLTSVKYWSYYAQACFLYCWDHFIPIQSATLSKNLFPCISVEQTVQNSVIAISGFLFKHFLPRRCPQGSRTSSGPQQSALWCDGLSLPEHSGSYRQLKS